MNRQEILEAALSTFGKQAQMMVAIEECSELIKALCKLPRGGSDTDVIDEIVDVQIMIDQLKTMFPSDEIAKKEAQKVERLAERIKTFQEGIQNGTSQI